MRIFERYLVKSKGDHEVLVKEATLAWPYHLAAWASLLFLGIVGIGIAIWGGILLWLRNTEFGLTNRKIIYKSGIFTRTTHEIPLTSVDEVEVHQGFWGRILNFGRLHIWGSGRGKLVTPLIMKPVDLRAIISDARARIIQPTDMQPEELEIDEEGHVRGSGEVPEPLEERSGRRPRRRVRGTVSQGSAVGAKPLPKKRPARARPRITVDGTGNPIAVSRPPTKKGTSRTRLSRREGAAIAEYD